MSGYHLYENPFCDLEYKCNQCEFDSIANEEYYASHNRVNFSHNSYHDSNLIPLVNNKSLYPKFYKKYKSNKHREMIFISNQHLCLYPNELKFELLHVS